MQDDLIDAYFVCINLRRNSLWRGLPKKFHTNNNIKS